MPSLVLKTVIKYISLAFLLFFSLISHSQPTSTHTHKRQMKPQFFISRAMVFHDMRLWGECAEKSMMVVVWNVLFDQWHCEGYFFTVVVEFHVVELQIKDVPLTAIDRFVADSVFCFSLTYPGRSTIGLETFLNTQGKQLVANESIIFFKMF